jgi:hypothetical protein
MTQIFSDGVDCDFFYKLSPGSKLLLPKDRNITHYYIGPFTESNAERIQYIITVITMFLHDVLNSDESPSYYFGDAENIVKIDKTDQFYVKIIQRSDYGFITSNEKNENWSNELFRLVTQLFCLVNDEAGKQLLEENNESDFSFKLKRTICSDVFFQEWDCNGDAICVNFIITDIQETKATYFYPPSLDWHYLKNIVPNLKKMLPLVSQFPIIRQNIENAIKYYSVTAI